MSAPTVTDSLGIARRVLARGWRPIPLDHPSHRRCIGSHADDVDPKTKKRTPFDRRECEAGVSANGLPRESRRGKHPVGGWAEIASSAPSEKFLDWTFARKTVNVGIATKASGLFVVDEDELGAFEKLCRELGHSVPMTYRVRTGKGWHWYFTAPGDVVLGNASGVLKARGMDVRGGKGNGGYVVAAGSVHHSGHVYTAEDEDALAAPCPRWLVAILTDPGEVDAVHSDAGTGSASRHDRDEVRLDTLAGFTATYRAHLAAVSSPGFRHSFFAAARDGWRLYDLGGITFDELVDDLNAVARRTWGADLNTADERIFRTEARQAATASPWELLDTGGVKIEKAGASREWTTRTGPSTDRDEPQVGEGGEEAERTLIEAQKALLRRKRIATRELDAEERGPVPPPASTSLRDLLAEEPNAAKYRVDRLWPSGGKVLITAAKKSGKTTMVGNLVRCLVDGDRFLGRPFSPIEATDGVGFTVTRDERAVFLFDFEMTRDMLREWLRDQGIQDIDRVHVELMRGRALDLRDDDVRGQWAAHLRSLDVGTLIVDPIGPVLAGLGLDENSNTEVAGYLAMLDRLCLEAGVKEYAVVHHAGHGEEQRARGASAFVGWPDAWWQITRGEEATFLRAEGRDVDLDETALVFDRSTRRLTLGQGNRVEVKASADASAVCDLVKQNPGATRNDLVKLLRESDGWGTQRSRDAITAAVAARVVHAHSGANRAQHHHPESCCDRCPPLEMG